VLKKVAKRKNKFYKALINRTSATRG